MRTYSLCILTLIAALSSPLACTNNGVEADREQTVSTSGDRTTAQYDGAYRDIYTDAGRGD